MFSFSACRFPETSAWGADHCSRVWVPGWLADEGGAAVTPGAHVQGRGQLPAGSVLSSLERIQPGGAQGGRQWAQHLDTDSTWTWVECHTITQERVSSH